MYTIKITTYNSLYYSFYLPTSIILSKTTLYYNSKYALPKKKDKVKEESNKGKK